MTIKEEVRKSQEVLEKEYKAIERRRQELKREIINIESDLIEYRIKSAKRVIEFVARNNEKISPRYIETYLVHCLNKLNGNIDGVELTLGQSDEEANANNG